MRSQKTLLAIVLFVAPTVLAQSGIGVELDEVIDNRMSAGMLTGSLDIRVNLKGNGLDRASGARIVVKEARDDRGNALVDKSSAEFTPRDYNGGRLQLGLRQPARAASSVTVKGTVELYVPGRDPNAVIKIEKALTRLDAPFSSKSLKAAKLEITPLSPAGYAAALKARKLDDQTIAAIRAEGKKRGAPEKEVELMIGLAKALESSDAEVPEGALLLSAKKSDFDRIFRIDVLGGDGKPLDIRGRTTSTIGDSSLMTLQPAEAPPGNAALQFYVLTDKSRLSFPFELNVQLP